MAITFHCAPIGSATRRGIAREELGVPREEVHLQTGAREGRAPAFMAARPGPEAQVKIGTMMGNLSFEPLANVGRWGARCQQRPAFMTVPSGA